MKKLLTFASPQTGNIYIKVTDGNYMFVGARYIGGNEYRITVRCDEAHALAALEFALPGWSGIKAGDHRSVVIHEAKLSTYVNDAMRAVERNAGLGPVNTEWRDQVNTLANKWFGTQIHSGKNSNDGDPDYVFTCPNCGTSLEVTEF